MIDVLRVMCVVDFVDGVKCNWNVFVCVWCGVVFEVVWCLGMRVLEVVDDKEMLFDVLLFYVKKGGVVDFLDDEIEGLGAFGRGASGKIMIEIKLLFVMMNVKMNEKLLDVFFFVLLLWVRMLVCVDVVEGVNVDLNATSTTDRSENEASGMFVVVDVVKDGLDEV